MKVLHIIPARGGSKNIPNKNIKKLHGKRLIYYSIDAAREVASDKDICVSTDSDKIKSIVEDYGLSVPFIRPKEISDDKAPTSEVIKHAYDFYLNHGIRYDVISILQPTSPFRKGSHIKEAMQLYDDEIDMVVGVFKTKSNPYFVLYEENDQGFLEKSKKGHFTRRQDCPQVYQINGAIYLLNCKSIDNFLIGDIKKIKAYLMDDIFSIDIDKRLDWEFAEFILKKGLIK